jgi:hypothetical protein
MRGYTSDRYQIDEPLKRREGQNKVNISASKFGRNGCDAFHRIATKSRTFRHFGLGPIVLQSRFAVMIKNSAATGAASSSTVLAGISHSLPAQGIFF